MLKLPKKFTRLHEDQIQSWIDAQACIDVIIDHHNIVKTKEEFHLNHFHLLDTKNEINGLQFWKVGNVNNAFTLGLIEYREPSVISSQMLLFGHLKIKINLGKTLIKPESIKDKISELFQPIEIDFDEHKKFSRKYYVLTVEEALLRRNMPLSLMDFLTNAPSPTLEFGDEECIFTTDNSLNPKEALKLCEMGLELDLILNHSD